MLILPGCSETLTFYRDAAHLRYFKVGKASCLLKLTPSFYVIRVCEEPASAEPHTWPDDITKWPVGLPPHFLFKQRYLCSCVCEGYAARHFSCGRSAHILRTGTTLGTDTWTVKSRGDPAV